MHRATLDAAAGKDAGEGTGMMVAAILVVRFDLRRAAELGGHHNQRVVKLAGFGEVRDEGGVGLVELLAAAFDAGEIVVVGIPPSELDLHKAHTVLHQAAGQQAALGEATTPIKVAGGLAFLTEIEGLQVLGIHQGNRLAVEFLVGLHIGIRIAAVELAVHLVRQSQAALEILRSHLAGARRILESIIRTADGRRGIFRAEKAATRDFGGAVHGHEARQLGVDATAEFYDPRAE